MSPTESRSRQVIFLELDRPVTWWTLNPSRCEQMLVAADTLIVTSDERA